MSEQNSIELRNKIRTLEQINKRLLEEYAALERNYEVISSKFMEERNISKRLQDSINLSQNKEKNEDLIIQLNTYKENMKD